MSAFVCLVLGTLVPGGAYISLGVALILFVCAILFSSLSVEITDKFLCWEFGPGPIRKQVLISDIDAAETTRTKLIDGWGIHRTSRGWLYNVSGFDAVAIELKTGKQFLLGTDEPERLASVLREQLPRA